LTASAHAPRRFTVERTVGVPRYRVTGEVEDDYRYRATFALDGRDVHEEYVLDDRRLLRLADASALPEGGDRGALGALLSGAWVADSANAPAEFPKTGTAVRLLDPAVVLEPVRFLERIGREEGPRRLLRGAARHDPGSTRYLRSRDKFEAHKEAGVRYDVVPGNYDGDLLFRNDIPQELERALEPSFLYVSYWFRDGRITRVERFFDIDVDAVSRDLRAAAERQAGRARVNVSVIPVPPVPQPYRDVYTFEYPGEPVRLTAPTPSATVTLHPIGADPTPRAIPKIP
jgi:hypothetical protein